MEGSVYEKRPQGRRGSLNFFQFSVQNFWVFETSSQASGWNGNKNHDNSCTNLSSSNTYEVPHRAVANNELSEQMQPNFAVFLHDVKGPVRGKRLVTEKLKSWKWKFQYLVIFLGEISIGADHLKLGNVDLKSGNGFFELPFPPKKSINNTQFQ